jgi:hypothetical protein
MIIYRCAFVVLNMCIFNCVFTLVHVLVLCHSVFSHVLVCLCCISCIKVYKYSVLLAYCYACVMFTFHKCVLNLFSLCTHMLCSDCKQLCIWFSFYVHRYWNVYVYARLRI